MAMPHYQKFMPNLKSEYKAINQVSNFNIPKTRLQKIGSRAASEARTVTKNQKTQLDNLRRSLRHQRTSALNQLNMQEQQLPGNFQSSLQSALQSAIADQHKRGPIKSSGLMIQNMLAGGAQAQATNASNLGKVANQQTQVEQNYLNDLVSKVMQPKQQLAQKQGQTASNNYLNYVNAAKQAVYQGHINKAENLLNKAQQEYNNHIQTAQNQFQSWLQGAKGNVTKAQMNALKQLAGQSGSGRKYTGGGKVDNWLAKAIKATGVPMSWLPGLKIIAMHESSGNPNAVNNWDSNAAAGHASQGLMQTIPSTFNAYKQKGHGNILNPVDNAIAAINYIKSRYGDINNVPGVKAIRQGRKYVGY